MTVKAFIKFMERETLLLLSIVLSGCILLPTAVLLIMTFFSDVPRTASIFDGYRYLFDAFGSARWPAYAVTIGPYTLVQTIRSIRWVLKKAKQDAC